MHKIDREKQFKEAINKLEQLVLKAEKDRKECENNEEEATIEERINMIQSEAYEDGVFAAYAIVKKVFEEDYE